MRRDSPTVPSWPKREYRLAEHVYLPFLTRAYWPSPPTTANNARVRQTVRTFSKRCPRLGLPGRRSLRKVSRTSRGYVHRRLIPAWCDDRHYVRARIQLRINKYTASDFLPFSDRFRCSMTTQRRCVMLRTNLMKANARPSHSGLSSSSIMLVRVTSTSFTTSVKQSARRCTTGFCNRAMRTRSKQSCPSLCLFIDI